MSQREVSPSGFFYERCVSMDRIINLVPNALFVFAKIGLVTAIIIMSVHYTYIRYELEKVCTQASLDGFISQSVLESGLAKTGLEDKIVIIECSPPAGSYVQKLGDPLRVRVRYTTEIKVFGDYSVKLSIPVSASAANEGYYGEGY